MNDERAADGYNAGYAEQLYEKDLRDRGLVPPSLSEWYENGGSIARAPVMTDRTAAEGPTGVDPSTLTPLLRTAAAAGSLVESYRTVGHLAVPIDPLGSLPPGHPSLDPEFHGVTDEDLSRIPAAAIGQDRHGETALDATRALREVYCERIGYELDHMEDPVQWNWLVEYIESGRHLEPVDEHGKVHLLRILTEVDGLESFLQRSYLGQKRFSIEGIDMMVPMIRRIIRRTALAGTKKFFIGMAHRGRLNVLAHIIGFPYESLLAEFEGRRSRGMQSRISEAGSGDVKYHVGARQLVRSPVGELEISLAPNPSHLEHVNPVVQGMARAAREVMARESGAPLTGEDESGLDAFGTAVLPILVHGDSAFMGQGIVPETLNLARLHGYENGGTIHIVANNQLGFTTDPFDTRSSRYASDIALGFRVPILHVNADDPEACLSAVQLAIDFHMEFAEDVVVDLVGYRRYGHNEGDEPSYTQPLMYRKIREHPTVRQIWADQLVSEGVVTQAEVDEMSEAAAARLSDARARATDESPDAETDEQTEYTSTAGTTLGIGMEVERDRPRAYDVLTVEEAGWRESLEAPSVDRLRELNDAIHAWPEGFEPNPKLERQLERRRASLEDGIEWAHAEALAFASLVSEGVPVRLSGEDSERGTFSQRHLVLHDAGSGATWTPLKHVEDGQGQFQVWNSPLSEAAVLGFEYGYSTTALDTLVLWEAQFGDFANVAQAIIDQFIVAGRSKWGQESRLALLLPHGYEGQGPEHSSARLERFLELAAEQNIRVANLTTPAQYFHLLRLQALRPARRPLVLMTPKSLLRHPAARSSLRELSEDHFHPVLPGLRSEEERTGVGRIVLCSGKVFYDLVGSESWTESDSVDVIRVERIQPFPEEELAALFTQYPNATEIVWLQEEPANMGAWQFVRPRLERLGGPELSLRYVGRPERASPAEGYAAAHQLEQQSIVEAALSDG
ncbi:MAG: 2-oxoglutarate dehydrogenase E1 component [marine benthic group bacterium]|nr:2-oxoglutarate dehydrogenase E1 component [Gemmatimonadota bacterium]MCL7979532.1 2-oxoglutarate dehydrogenase E1 component [Gemmatimonadota bacterium]